MYLTVILMQALANHILDQVAPATSESINVKFARETYMDDYKCNKNIIKAEETVSLVACVQQCRHNEHEAGISLIFNELTSYCQCHRSANTTELDCTLHKDSGSKFYSLVTNPVTISVPTSIESMTLAVTSNAITPPPTTVGVYPYTLIGVPMTQNTTTGMDFYALLGVPMTQTVTPVSLEGTSTVPESITHPTTLTSKVWDFRLVNGTATSGRLEVYYNGIWGVVYGFSFSVEDATVMCRDILQITNYGYPIYGDYFGVPDKAVGLTKDYDSENDLICNSNQTCYPWSWKAENETEFREFGTVGLDCSDYPIEVQLADGVNSTSGRLEVKLLNKWGTVCGDSQWEDGPMFCRYFGWNYTTFELAGDELTTGPIWIHGSLYACDYGNETNPADCQWSPYTKSYFSQNCNHTADVILYCY